MKSIVMPKNEQLNEEAKDQLATAVNETQAQGAGVQNNKRLTVMDMWNLQRNSRSASAMIRRWNFN